MLVSLESLFFIFLCFNKCLMFIKLGMLNFARKAFKSFRAFFLNKLLFRFVLLDHVI